MHAPRSSHSSLVFPDISVLMSWQGLRLQREYIKWSRLQVCEQLALTDFLSFPKILSKFPSVQLKLISSCAIHGWLEKSVLFSFTNTFNTFEVYYCSSLSVFSQIHSYIAQKILLPFPRIEKNGGIFFLEYFSGEAAFLDEKKSEILCMWIFNKFICENGTSLHVMLYLPENVRFCLP